MSVLLRSSIAIGQVNWIVYHPEYSKLHFAETTLASSFAWLDNVLNCNSYQTALTNGYLSPLTNDPYFTFNSNQGYVPADKTTMAGYLTSKLNPSSPSNNSIWLLVNSTALCAYDPSPERPSGLHSKPAGFGSGHSRCFCHPCAERDSMEGIPQLLPGLPQ